MVGLAGMMAGMMAALMAAEKVGMSGVIVAASKAV